MPFISNGRPVSEGLNALKVNHIMFEAKACWQKQKENTALFHGMKMNNISLITVFRSS